MRSWIGAVVLCGIWASAAHAWDKGAVAMPGNANQSCAIQQTGQVGVSFNNVLVTNPARIGADVDQKIDEITALAKQAGIAKIEVQSYNYSVYPVSSAISASADVPYQYSGSVSFAVEPPDKATGLMSLLASKGYSANLNVSGYRQCQ